MSLTATFEAEQRVDAPAAPSVIRHDAVRIVSDRAGLAAIAADWRALEESAGGAIFFQSASWAEAVFDFAALHPDLDFDPAIAVLVHDGRLAGVLPLERIGSRFRRMLVPLGRGFAQYSDMVLAPGLDPRAAFVALLAAARAEAPADIAGFYKVRAGSVLDRALPDTARPTGERLGAPYVDLSAHADYAAYFATLKSKTRKNMRNARNRLEREGALTHDLAGTSEDKLGVITRTLEGRADRLASQGLTSRAFSDEAFFDFCKGLAGRPTLDIMAMSLKHNGEPIAEQWGFVHLERYYAFVASRDFAHSDESPGKLHLGEVTAACAERGLKGADLLVPAMPYKLTWATETVEVSDRLMPLTARGKLLSRLWDGALRPRLKAMVLAMPAGPRGAVMRLLGRSPSSRSVDESGPAGL